MCNISLSDVWPTTVTAIADTSKVGTVSLVVCITSDAPKTSLVLGSVRLGFPVTGDDVERDCWDFRKCDTEKQT